MIDITALSWTIALLFGVPGCVGLLMYWICGPD